MSEIRLLVLVEQQCNFTILTNWEDLEGMSLVNDFFHINILPIKGGLNGNVSSFASLLNRRNSELRSNCHCHFLVKLYKKPCEKLAGSHHMNIKRRHSCAFMATIS